MAEEDTSKYRKRVEDDSGGLAKEDVRRHPSAGGLAFQELAESCDTKPLALTAIADQLLPERDEEDLPDFGIGLLLAEQRTGRLRELLEHAQKLIASGRLRPALLAVEEALAADRTSGEAWALKGRCLTELGYYEAAFRVFRHARDEVSDPELRILILKLEADCVHASTRALETQLVQLAEKGQLAEALKLVNEGLRRQPSNIVFLYHRAHLHWLSGERALAEQIIEEARRHVGGESIDLIVELERKIEFGPHRSAVEAARTALRKGELAATFRHLDSCGAELRGNVHYEGLRAYAERKRRTFGQLLGSKGPVQPPGAQQQTLRWLLAEEIQQADDALRRGDYARASSVLEQAAGIESECGAVCYRHARAIFLSFRQGGTRKTVGDLKAAEALAARAAVDPGYQEMANGLVKGIRELRARQG